MANTISKTRTNFVGITDFDRFKHIISSCVADNGEKLEIIENTDANGVTKYGFCIEENICGMRERDEFCEVESCADCEYFDDCDKDYSYDDFLEELTKVIAPGDALIITNICYQKMCSLYAYADIVTSESVESLTLEDLALKKAQKLLGNNDWHTVNEGGEKTKLD